MTTAPLPDNDCIVALASAPGRGALALLRLSGEGTHEVAARVIQPWPATARRATRVRLVAADGTPIDDAVAVRYDAPASYTGDDAVEVMTHGGALVPQVALSAFLEAGARQALPGEYTRRAVLAGKMDLLQAEAVADLTSAASRGAHRAALHQLDGGLSRRITELRDAMLELEALIAYDIDFPEEDDGPIDPARIRDAIDRVTAGLDTLLATAHAGELVREGALVVIAGPPNAGKSSLFNALLGRERAIVTEIPGTTRDALEAVVDSGRWPLRLVDTAGLREAGELVERLGIEVSERYLAGADVVLACADDPTVLGALREGLRTMTRAPVLPVLTKSDLRRDSHCDSTDGAVAVSARSGGGLRDLLAAIDATIEAQVHVPLEADAPLLTRTRHRVAVEAARAEMEEFRRGWEERAVPAVIAAVHVRAAVGAMEELIGGVGVEDVLGRVFERFCVGK